MRRVFTHEDDHVLVSFGDGSGIYLDPKADGRGPHLWTDNNLLYMQDGYRGYDVIFKHHRDSDEVRVTFCSRCVNIR